jgi:hypothetical protein
MFRAWGEKNKRPLSTRVMSVYTSTSKNGKKKLGAAFKPPYSKYLAFLLVLSLQPVFSYTVHAAAF